MKKSTRLFAGMLTLCELALTACGSTGTAPGSDTTAAPSGDSGTTASPEVTYTPNDREYFEPLAKEDLGGYRFRIAVPATNSNSSDGKFFDVEEQNGESINDAKYKQIHAVEDLYSITIDEVVAADGVFRSSVLAADDLCDCYFTALYRSQANLASGDYLYDCSTIRSLNLDRMWWDQNLQESGSIAGKQFFLAGDIDYTLYGRSLILMFNKPMFAQYFPGEDIYKLVLDGKWTFDKLDEFQRRTTFDLDGDSKMTDKDSYGIICSAVHAYALYAASGEKIVKKNGDDLSIVMNNAHGVDVINRVFEVTLGAAQYCYNTDLDSSADLWTKVLEMFRAEHALMQSTVLYNIIKQRSMEIDFGILPYPKYDEEQENYYATSYNGNSVLSIPKTIPDAEKTGKILNALAFEGRFTVKPAFYDEALGVKFIRDEESRDMLDIVFDSINYDVGFMYNVGSLGELIRSMHKSGNDNFVSSYASLETSAKTSLAALVETFEKLS